MLKLAGKSTHLDSIIEPLDSITEETYEVGSCKKTIKLNLPIQVGFLFISMPSYAGYTFIMIFWINI